MARDELLDILDEMENDSHKPSGSKIDFRCERCAKGSKTPELFHFMTQMGNPISTKMDLNRAKKQRALGELRKRNFEVKDVQKAASEVFNCSDPEILCDELYPFQSADGSCNNLRNPTWGMSNSPYLRLEPAYYEDDMSEMRKAQSGNDLPSPRLLSISCHSQINRPDVSRPNIVMVFGQFLDHDMTKAPPATKDDGNPLECCGDDMNDTRCGKIPIPKIDQFSLQYNRTCLNAPRTQRYDSCSNDRLRNQVNVITAVLDASMVYGNNKEDAADLRAFKNGELKSCYDKDAGELLPPSQKNSTCKDNIMSRGGFNTGDTRAGQHNPLICLHTVFLRFHNLIARILSKLNPHWKDEILYQVARSILISVYQRVVYEEFLPVIIGYQMMKKWNLFFERSDYNPHLNPGMIHECTTAAYRLHSIVSSEFVSICQDGCKKSGELRDIFFQPSPVYEGACKCIIPGLLQSPTQKYDRYIVNDLRNHLFRVKGTCFGLDLAALNILRGRDHGLQPYARILYSILGIKIHKFEDLWRKGLMNIGSVACLESTYESVYDIDLFTGGLSELPVKGAMIGPTFINILGRQFHHLKYGNRFFSTHSPHPNLNDVQKNAIRNMKLSDIFCCTGFIKFSQQFVMQFPSEKNPIEECQFNLDLSAWKEEAVGEIQNAPITNGQYEQWEEYDDEFSTIETYD